MERQTRININEGLMLLGFTMAGFTFVNFGWLSFGFILVGLYGYVQVGRIVSHGRCKPFWEGKKWNFGKK